MTDNKCGSCSLCCKLFYIEALEKPKDKWCKHCEIGKACNIYDTRPPACVAFKCAWLQSQDHKTPWPEKYRPDRVRFFVYSPDSLPDQTHLSIVQVDPSYKGTWRTGDGYFLLSHIVTQGENLAIVEGDKSKPILMERVSKNKVQTRTVTPEFLTAYFKK